MANHNFMIKFDGVYYLARRIHLDGFGETIVSVEGLNEVIMDEERGDYVNDSAKWLDESICYYVPEEKMNYSDEELAEYVSMQVDEHFVAKEFTPKRANQITKSLIAEMEKTSLVRENTVNIDAFSMTLEEWYDAIRPYFEMCNNTLKEAGVAKSDYYDWLSLEVGLRLIEIDLLELKGIIKAPEFVNAA